MIHITEAHGNVVAQCLFGVSDTRVIQALLIVINADLHPISCPWSTVVTAIQSKLTRRKFHADGSQISAWEPDTVHRSNCLDPKQVWLRLKHTLQHFLEVVRKCQPVMKAPVNIQFCFKHSWISPALFQAKYVIGRTNYRVWGWTINGWFQDCETSSVVVQLSG